jgi:hypothetical protein
MGKLYENYCLTQSWPNLEVVHNLPEGSGVVSTSEIERGSFVCNYGGQFFTVEEGSLIQDRDYLLEVQASQSFCLYHSKRSSFSFGKFVNHSFVHPNLLPKFVERRGVPDVLFMAKRKIGLGEELCYNYGSRFQGVDKCISSCHKCCK